MSEDKKIINITRASRETLDRLQNSCVEVMERNLEALIEADHARGGPISLYERATGLPLPPEVVEIEDEDIKLPQDEFQPTPIPFGNHKLTGSYSARLEIPDLTDEKDKEAVLTDVLEHFATYDVLLATLQKSAPKEIYRYFDPLPPRVLEHGGRPETEYILNGEGARELRPVIDACTAELRRLFEAKEPDCEQGARMDIRYVVGTDGSISFITPRRRYIESVQQEFTVMLPDLSESENLFQILNMLLPEQINVSAVRGNMLATQHPEYDRLFGKDRDGALTLTEKGKTALDKFGRHLAKDLAKEIAKLPKPEKESMIRVSGMIDEDGLHNPQLTYRQTFGVRAEMPNTEGKTDSERDDIYERAAINVAHDLLAANMEHLEPVGYERQRKLMAIEYLRKTLKTEDPEDANILRRAVEDGKISLQSEEASKLESTYYKVLEGVREEMLAIKEEKAFPFYIGMTAWEETDEEGRPRLTFDHARKVFLDPTRKEEKNRIIIDVPAAPDRKLTREAMKESAADIVDKVISNIIVPHMQGQRHGYLTTCFTQDPKTGLHLLTEEGASMLERTINELAAHAATATMNLRAMVPEQLAGFRFRLGYKVAESDSFYVMPREVKMEYFHQDKVQTHFAVPGLSPRVADVKVELETLVRTLKAKGGEPGTTRQPEAYRNIALLGEHFKAVYGQAVDLEKGTVTVTPDMLASAWKQNYKTALEYVAGTIAVKIMEANMRGSSKRGIPQHPAYDAFFARDERGNFILTDTGRNVLGQMADQCTQRIYADLLRQRPSERGHACRLTYEISGRGSIDYKMEALTLEEAFGPQYARMLGRK